MHNNGVCPYAIIFDRAERGLSFIDEIELTSSPKIKSLSSVQKYTKYSKVRMYN